jgi:hypothetical protein
MATLKVAVKAVFTDTPVALLPGVFATTVGAAACAVVKVHE